MTAAITRSSNLRKTTLIATSHLGFLGQWRLVLYRTYFACPFLSGYISSPWICALPTAHLVSSFGAFPPKLKQFSNQSKRDDS
jgi:hypothetical protein